MKKLHFVFGGAIFVLFPFFVRADVTLPAIISDHMVLQKAAKVSLWGKATPGEDVAVTLDTFSAKTKASDDGKWRVELNLQDARPGPFQLIVEGKNRLVVSDVLVGEVWLASGQSNMEFTLSRNIDAATEIAQSANPMLRQFLVMKAACPEPADDCKGSWVIAGPNGSADFSAVAYFFGKKLQSEIKGPVGLINSCWGGTPVEAWTSAAALDSVPDLQQGRAHVEEQLQNFFDNKKRFASDFAAWLKATGREDKAVQDPQTYAAPASSTQGWIPITLSGKPPGRLPSLPANGAIWLRRDVTISAVFAQQILPLNLGAIEGFEAVYWNGQLVEQTTYQDYPGTGFFRHFYVPAKLVQLGMNTLAIRVYSPVVPFKFPYEPRTPTFSIGGDWLAKVEFELPVLDPTASAAAPPAPASVPRPEDVACALFNGMIHPILPYAIRGTIWYQGEGNAGRAWQYRTAFPLMITDWRTRWNEGDFPFYLCQLANYMPKKADPGESAWAELRDAQSQALKLPHTGQAVLIDLGEAGEIHYRNKRDAGERLALIALAHDYGGKLPFSGPVYESMKIEDAKIRVSFTQTDGGLMAKPLAATYVIKSQTGETAPLVRNSPVGDLEGFTICGEDRKWVWADAKIDGDSVVVGSDKVPAPIAVRYAWADNPTCNLYNGAGLPASPFRTDDFPAATLNSKY